MYRVELFRQDGGIPSPQLFEASLDYGSAEDALAVVLPLAKKHAETNQLPLWFRIYDERSRVVFGTLLP